MRLITLSTTPIIIFIKNHFEYQVYLSPWNSFWCPCNWESVWLGRKARLAFWLLPTFSCAAYPAFEGTDEFVPPNKFSFPFLFVSIYLWNALHISQKLDFIKWVKYPNYVVKIYLLQSGKLLQLPLVFENERVSSWPPLSQILFSSNVSARSVENSTLASDCTWNWWIGKAEMFPPICPMLVIIISWIFFQIYGSPLPGLFAFELSLRHIW